MAVLNWPKIPLVTSQKFSQAVKHSFLRDYKETAYINFQLCYHSSEALNSKCKSRYASRMAYLFLLNYPNLGRYSSLQS